MAQKIVCHSCRAGFPLDPERLRPYRDGLIQGQRLPRYWTSCPYCKQKNVIQLSSASKVISGKLSAR